MGNSTMDSFENNKVYASLCSTFFQQIRKTSSLDYHHNDQWRVGHYSVIFRQLSDVLISRTSASGRIFWNVQLGVYPWYEFSIF